jgi:hypothetical protein
MKAKCLAIFDNDLGNHIVDVDDAIVKTVKRCVEPKARFSRGGTLALSWIAYVLERDYEDVDEVFKPLSFQLRLVWTYGKLRRFLNIVHIGDAIVKRCVKPKARVLRGGTLALGFTHRFTIASSTLTIRFPRSLSYMANHMGFKVNHMVQGHPPGSRSTADLSRPILLILINLQVASNAECVFTSWGPFGFRRRTFLHGVCWLARFFNNWTNVADCRLLYCVVFLLVLDGTRYLCLESFRTQSLA